MLVVLVLNELLVHSIGFDALCAESVDSIRNNDVVQKGGDEGTSVKAI